MSPAMVDVRTPSATPQSPTNPQIPAQSNPSPNPDPSSMDRGGCSLFGEFVPPFPSPSFPASNKPAGLSKPRLTKTRRHLASPRVRQATISDAQLGPAANPFRSGMHAASGSGNAGGSDLNPDAKKAVSVNEGSRHSSVNLDAKNIGVFVFGSGVKKSSISSRSSSVNLDESSSSKFPNIRKEGEKDVRAGNLFVFGSMMNAADSVGVHEVCKTGLHSAGNEGGFENAKAADRSSKLDGSNAGIFGSSKNVPGCVGGGSGDTLPDKTPNSTRSSSIGSDEGLSSKLPEDTKKMNMQSNGIENGYEFRSRPDDTTEVDGKNMFVFGSSKGAPGFFGDHTRSYPPWNGSGLSEGSSFCSIDSSSSKLPDQMRKLNLQSSNDEGSLEHGKEDGHKFKVDESKVFIFGSVKNTPGLFDCAMENESPDEMRNKDIGSETVSQTKDESVNFAPGAFVFGSNARSSVLNQNSAASSTSYDKRTASVVNTESLKKTTETCTSNGLASGSSWEIPSSLQGGSTATLPDDIRKLQSKKVEPFAGSTNQMFTPSGLATDSLDNSLNFAYLAEKQNTNMRTQAVPASQPHDHCRSAGVTDSSSHPSTPGPKIEPTGAEFTFTGMRVKSEAPNMEFKTLNQDASCFRDNMFTGLQQNLESGTKEKVAKGTKMNKKKGKLRPSVSFQQRFAEHFTPRETGSHENPGTESPAGCSPMDCSPYQEILISDPCSREISMTSDEPTLHASYGAFIDAQKDDLVSAAQHLGTKKGDGKHGDVDDGKSHAESDMPKNEDVGSKIYTDTTAKEAESLLFSSNPDQQSTESRTSFSFSSSVGVGEPCFTFISSPSVHGRSSLLKRHYRRKDRVKAGQHLFNSTHDAKVPFASSPFQVASTSAHNGTVQGLNGIPFVPQSGSDSSTEKNNDVDIKSESTPTETVSIAAKEACEKWRLRGNEAYANGFLVKAEDYYTRGVDSVSPKETSKSCMKALMLCYSNRAATRMSLGRMREALSDCLMAAAIDPSFLKAQLRAGNCHLALGESQDAMKHFKKCLQLGDDANIDKKISTEALEGLQKAQKVADCVDESAELLVKRTVSEARRALDIISEALSISPHSERLLEMKAEALFMLRSFEEVVQLCQQTMESGDRNNVRTDCDSSEGRSVSPGSLWRWRLISKSYFYLGKLEEALDFLQKHEQVEPVVDKYRSMPPVSSAPLSVTIRDLLRLKAAGNEAFQAGRHLEAVEHYTAALACNTESRPFAAICFCNRAAAYQALGQVADAIADCSLAIALESGYAKAISRRATLHEMIRDYGQAASDIRRLISLLEQQTEAAENSSDVKQARRRLSAMEEEVKKDIPLDMYMILGIQQSCSTVDVKKAYRKAALRHHPDKAVQFLARSDVDDGLWKDIANEMRKDADRLFKMIGEAYSILSDPTKRTQYDTEEEMRTASKKGNSGIGTPRTPKTAAEGYSSPYEKNVNRRQWRSYRSSQQNWSEYSRSNM